MNYKHAYEKIYATEFWLRPFRLLFKQKMILMNDAYLLEL